MKLSASFTGLAPRQDFRQRLDLGAAIFAPYVLAFVWQYLSLIKPSVLAWALALIVSTLIWCFYVAIKEPEPEKLSAWFWLIVATPLLFVYLMRAPFPEIAFDVLNYHIFNGERALRGAFFLPGDFFPTVTPFNPTPDILTGLYRHVLGYRLGTVVNYLALIWTGAILDRLLRDYVRKSWLRGLAVLFVLCTEQLLFQINEYMVDLLALPLLLETMTLVLRKNGADLMKRTACLALLSGVATALKLSNLLFLAPIMLVYAFDLIAHRNSDSLPRPAASLLKSAPLAALLFVAPSLPFLILIYRLTGNPVFPLYNGLFKSPYWPQGTALDPRWGPSGIYETVIWPVLMFFKADRLSEFTFYSGRLSIGYLVGAVCLFLARSDRTARAIALITLSASLLWSATSGYIRYALFLELTSGVLLIWLLAFVWRKCARVPLWGKVLAQIPLWLLLIAQSSIALKYVNRWEWSTRTTLLAAPKPFLHESSNLLRDRSLKAYVAAEDLALFDTVDVWVETTYKTSAFTALLKPDIPGIGLRMPNYFGTNKARQTFFEVLRSAAGKRMFTLTNRESLPEARDALAARGLSLGEPRPVSIYYFSKSLRFDMLLVEVRPNWQNTSGQPEKGVPLPDMAFNATLSVADMPGVMRAGDKYTIHVALQNNSDIVWPGRQLTWRYQITIGNRWMTEMGAKITDVDGRAPLLQDLKPTEAADLPLIVTAPNQPGNYILQLDLVQEGVAWFGDRGSEVLSLKVKVE